MTTIAQKLSLHSLPCRSHLYQHKLQLTSFNSTHQNQEKCILLRLPPELRNAVYKYVFLEDNIEICAPHSKKTDSHSHTHYPKQNLQLLQTCRQVYTEARLLPFASNQFKGSHWALRSITKLLSREQANAISTIHVLIDDMDIDIIRDKSDPRLYLKIFDTPSIWVLHWNMLSTLKRLARLPELKLILLSLSQYDCDI